MSTPKVTTAPDWTQAQLDANIAQGGQTERGNYPVGTLLSGIVLASDWNNLKDVTQTLTNKRITPRVLSAASYSVNTGTSINSDTQDIFIVTAQAEALLFNNPTGTPTNGQKLILSVTGTAARALTYGTGYEASTVALPATTVTTARLDIGFMWNVATSKWRCVASA